MRIKLGSDARLQMEAELRSAIDRRSIPEIQATTAQQFISGESPLEDEMLSLMFQARPAILNGCSPAVMRQLRTAAIMAHLLGERENRFLPRGLQTGLRYKNDAAARMIFFSAQQQKHLEALRRDGYALVRLAFEPECEECKKLYGSFFETRKPPELPNPHCTNEIYGCRCLFTIIEVQLKK